MKLKKITAEQIALQTPEQRSCIDLVRAALDACKKHNVHLVFDRDRQTVFFMNGNAVFSVWGADNMLNIIKNHFKTEADLITIHDIGYRDAIIYGAGEGLFSCLHKENTLQIIRQDPFNFNKTWEEEDD